MRCDNIDKWTLTTEDKTELKDKKSFEDDNIVSLY